jgi:hypothetical protein
MEFNVNRFLTYGQMDAIIKAVEAQSTMLERYFIKHMMLVQFCTDLEVPMDEDGNVTSDDYDKFVSDEVISHIYENVENIDILEKCIDYSQSADCGMNRMANAVIEFMDSINLLADKTMKNLPKSKKGWMTFLEQAKGVMSNDNESDTDNAGSIASGE